MINKGYVVGEWSEYFEDYPEEDPANQVNGVYSPELARERQMESNKPHVSDKEKKLRKEQQEIFLRLKGISK